MLREADLLGAGTEAEAYLRVAGERYRLIRTHEWNDEIIRAACATTPRADACRAR